jgi:RimJ/RimL family protein N-acetyltransferase
MNTITIRSFEPSDWSAVWAITAPVFRAGETYPYSPDITEDAARHAWVETPQVADVAVDDGGKVLGTYYIRPNQATLGAHVCNCGYIVAEAARGKGVGLCEHSQQEAVHLGFESIQYNLVASTNLQAIHVWTKNGMEIIGTLPDAFRDPQRGLVDAYVMHKQLRIESRDGSAP